MSGDIPGASGGEPTEPVQTTEVLKARLNEVRTTLGNLLEAGPDAETNFYDDMPRWFEGEEVDELPKDRTYIVKEYEGEARKYEPYHATARGDFTLKDGSTVNLSYDFEGDADYDESNGNKIVGYHGNIIRNLNLEHKPVAGSEAEPTEYEVLFRDDFLEEDFSKKVGRERDNPGSLEDVDTIAGILSEIEEQLRAESAASEAAA